MNIIDNFDVVINYLNFQPGYFYPLEVVRRKKENSDRKHAKVLRKFRIEDKEEYYKLRDTIRDMCEFFKARAYIRLNKREYKNIGLETLRWTAKYIADGDYRAVKNSFSKAVGNNHTEGYDRWIVDIDEKSKDVVNDVIKHIEHLQDHRDSDYSILGVVETPNGYHIITEPFDRRLFFNTYTDHDVKPDNPTILCSVSRKY